jgi:hypothetical protein
MPSLASPASSPDPFTDRPSSVPTFALVIGINLGQRSKTDIDTAIAFFRLKIPAGKSRGKSTKRCIFEICCT